MGKLFLPRETHGLWDAASRSLTVYVGEPAFVGFMGTPGEISQVQFSASGPQLGECANQVINEGPGRRSSGIDTSKPGTLQFTATDANGKPLAQPATIYIRFRPNYRQATPEGQMDETACWAACLTWWLDQLQDRPSVPQADFINKLGVGLWNPSDGTINPTQLETLVAKNGYRMRTRRVQPKDLIDYMGNWPLMIGFTASGGFGHMNVLCGYDNRHGTVDTMEPMYPDPIYNSQYRSMGAGNAGVPLFFDKDDGTPFVYDGAIRTGLSFSSFQQSPMQAGYFWIGYPQEYDAQP